jgi:hypothetical protein
LSPLIQNFPAQKLDLLPKFRNAILHCGWEPDREELSLDYATTRDIEKLHEEIGAWLEKHYLETFEVFRKKYETPEYWLRDPAVGASFG